MLFLSPCFFHSSFIHSTGTFGLPFSTAPQQHPRQSDKCAMTMRFVCMEKLAYGTILPSRFLQIFVTSAWPNRALRRRLRPKRRIRLLKARGTTSPCAFKIWRFGLELRRLNRFKPGLNGVDVTREFPLGNQT